MSTIEIFRRIVSLPKRSRGSDRPARRAADRAPRAPGGRCGPGAAAGDHAGRRAIGSRAKLAEDAERTDESAVLQFAPHHEIAFQGDADPIHGRVDRHMAAVEQDAAPRRPL